MALTIGDFVAQRLDQWGIQRIYGYPGDGINRLARVCLATSGPRGVHLLNGLYDAKLDHQPVVAIVGQQPSSVIGASYTQEVDLAPRRCSERPCSPTRCRRSPEQSGCSASATRPERPLQVVNAPRQDAEIPGGDDSFGSCGRDRTDLRPAELVAGLAPTRSGLSSCGTATQRVREGSCCARFEAWFHGGPPGAFHAPRSRRPADVSRCAAASGWPAAGAAGSARAARSDRGSHRRRGPTRR
jgi:hypothetical protein